MTYMPHSLLKYIAFTFKQWDRTTTLTFEWRAPAIVLLLPAGGVAITRYARGPVGDRAGSLLIPHR